MTKKQLNAILDQLTAEIAFAHGGTFDDSGARAILGAALRANRDALLGHMAGAGEVQQRVLGILDGSVVVPPLTKPTKAEKAAA